MKYNTLMRAGAVVFTMTAFPANAQSIQAKLTSISPALSVNGSFDYGWNYSNYTSGVNNFTSTSYGGFDFEAFCVEPTSYISVGQTLTYDVTPLSSLTNSDKVARLIGGFLGSSMDKDQAAAVQWAIWEVTADTSSTLSLSNGKVKVSSSSTKNLGNQYLANINSYTAADITYLTNSKFQNMISYKPGDAVPEPATLGLFALSGLLLFRRKR